MKKEQFYKYCSVFSKNGHKFNLEKFGLEVYVNNFKLMMVLDYFWKVNVSFVQILMRIPVHKFHKQTDEQELIAEFFSNEKRCTVD